MKLCICYIAAALASLMVANTAAAECSVGDTKCVASGVIKTCVERSSYQVGESGLETQWEMYGAYQSCDRPDRSASSSGRECTLGDQKCGADGWIVQCEESSGGSQKTHWSSIMTQCK